MNSLQWRCNGCLLPSEFCKDLQHGNPIHLISFISLLCGTHSAVVWAMVCTPHRVLSSFFPWLIVIDLLNNSANNSSTERCSESVCMCVFSIASRHIPGQREEKKEGRREERERERERVDGRKRGGMDLINDCLSGFDYKFHMVADNVYFHKPFFLSVPK